METTRPPPSFPGWRPFNEATTSRPWRRGLRQSRPHSDVRLQRSHDLSAVETSPSGKRWSAQGNLQRSHDLSAVETILRVINLMIGKDLQRSHDLSAVETRSFQCTLSKPRRTFNEATTSRPWRLLCFICNRFRVANLQRSHDLSAVETLLHYHTEHHLGATSTKPRPLGRGDLRLIPPPPHVQRTSTKPRPLGRGDLPEEAVDAVGQLTSTKPRPLGRGDMFKVYGLDGSTYTSTKPRPLGRGDSSTLAILASHALALQRSHDLSAVETRISPVL